MDKKKVTFDNPQACVLCDRVANHPYNFGGNVDWLTGFIFGYGPICRRCHSGIKGKTGKHFKSYRSKIYELFGIEES